MYENSFINTKIINIVKKQKFIKFLTNFVVFTFFTVFPECINKNVIILQEILYDQAHTKIYFCINKLLIYIMNTNGTTVVDKFI